MTTREALIAELTALIFEATDKRLEGAPLAADEMSDDRAGQGLGFIEAFVETKSVWHPAGL